MIQSTLRSTQLNKLHNLKQKVRLISCDICFLKKCKQRKVFPKFIQITVSVKNSVTDRVIQNAKCNWLNLEIKYLYSKQANLELQAYELHLQIAKNLNHLDFVLFQEKYLNILDSISFKADHKIEKLNKKFNFLTNLGEDSKNVIKSNNSSNDQTLVQNLSPYLFTTTELDVLSKGLNYSIKPFKEEESVFIDVETNIKFLPNNIKTAIRSDIVTEFKKYKNNGNNTSIKSYNGRIDMDVIKSLKDKNVYYLKADKSNTLVIIDKNDYIERVQKMIDEGPYEVCRNNPLNVFKTSVSNSFKNCKNILSKELIRRLTLPNPCIPRLYCLPKTHKPGNKMRPIVSSINSPTYCLSKWLVKELQTIPFPSTLSVKDRYDFLDKVKDIKIEPHEYMVSFDVESLYPNVPIRTTIDIIKSWMESNNISHEEIEEYALLINLCMNQNVFQFQNSFYKQTFGTAMGNPLSCFLANIFLSNFEINAKEVLNYFPRVWFRYVDDVFAIFSMTQNFQNFINNLNSFCPTIKFTHELKKNNTIPFLDLLITKNSCGNLEFDIYRKPNSNDRFIPQDSYTHGSQKRAVFHSLIHRLLNTPLNEDKYFNEVQKIKEIAKFNGFKPNLIDQMITKKRKLISKTSRTTFFENNKKEDVWKAVTFGSNSNIIQRAFKKHANIKIGFSSNSKLKFILGNPKIKIKGEDKSGIYEVKCDDCDKLYIGQTKRKISIRLKEHLNNFKNDQPEKSALAKHALETGHIFSKIKLLKEVKNCNYLDAHETLEMKKKENFLVNNEPGAMQYSPLLPLII